MIAAALCVLVVALAVLVAGRVLLCASLWSGARWLADVVVLQAARIAELESELEDTREELADQREAATTALAEWHRAEVRLLDAVPVFVHSAVVDA